MSEHGEIYTAGKNFTLPPALTAWTNSTSAISLDPVLLFPTPKKDKKITHTFESNSECFRTSTSVMLGSWHSSPPAKKDKFVFQLPSQTVEERGGGSVEDIKMSQKWGGRCSVLTCEFQRREVETEIK